MKTLAHLLPCLAALALAGCGGRTVPLVAVVGNVGTLSGADKDGGEQAARGIRLAVRQVNGQGGQTFTVIHTDARGQLEAFEAEAVRLVTVNRVSALIGGTTADEVERLDRARAVVVGLTGARTRAMSDFVFLTGLSPAARGRALARQGAAPLSQASAALGAGPGLGPLGAAAALTLSRATATRIAVLVDERREENVQAADAFAKELAAAGVPTPALRRYAKDAELDPLLKRVQGEKPGAVLVAAAPEAVRRLRGVLPGVPVLFAGGGDGLRALQAHPETQSGIYLATTFVRDAHPPRARAFIKDYKALFNEEPGPAAALAYESAGLLFRALQRTEGQPDRDALRRELQELQDVPGLFGPLNFGPGQVLRRPAFVVRLANGRPVLVRRDEP
jgi:ABC-type branched-subunit amino acid transport system substrate-binding protein